MDFCLRSVVVEIHREVYTSGWDDVGVWLNGEEGDGIGISKVVFARGVAETKGRERL